MKAMKTELRLSIPVGTWVRIEKMAESLGVPPEEVIRRIVAKAVSRAERKRTSPKARGPQRATGKAEPKRRGGAKGIARGAGAKK